MSSELLKTVDNIGKQCDNTSVSRFNVNNRTNNDERIARYLGHKCIQKFPKTFKFLV